MRQFQVRIKSVIILRSWSKVLSFLFFCPCFLLALILCLSVAQQDMSYQTDCFDTSYKNYNHTANSFIRQLQVDIYERELYLLLLSHTLFSGIRTA